MHLDTQVIRILLVGIPPIMYALTFGFISRDLILILGNSRVCQKIHGPGSLLICFTEVPSGKTFVVTLIFAFLFVLLLGALLITRCVTYRCNPVRCTNCFFVHMLQVSIGLGLPALADFLVYLTAYAIFANNNDSGMSLTMGDYSGYSVVSLGMGWFCTVIMSPFVINRPTKFVRLSGVLLGGTVAFLIIVFIVGSDARNCILAGHTELHFVGFILGFINVAVFAVAYTEALYGVDRTYKRKKIEPTDASAAGGTSSSAAEWVNSPTANDMYGTNYGNAYAADNTNNNNNYDGFF